MQPVKIVLLCDAISQPLNAGDRKVYFTPISPVGVPFIVRLPSEEACKFERGQHYTLTCPHAEATAIPFKPEVGKTYSVVEPPPAVEPPPNSATA